MEDRIVAAHRRLGELIESTLAALDSRDAREAERCLAQLSSDLEAHFYQEDHLYYPVIRALRPRTGADIRHFIAAHDGLRERCADVRLRIERDSPAAAARALESFAAAFAHHEEAEEALVRELEAAVEG